MPFRDHGGLYTKVQFATSLMLPSLIRRAAEETGKVSSTQYLQHAVAAALAHDLGLSEDELLEAMPPGRKPVPAFVEDGTRHTHGQAH